MPKKTKNKDKDTKARKGMARRTLNAAQFFYEQAGRVASRLDQHDYYIEAAIVFAWMVLEHLEEEFRATRGAEKWIRNNKESNPLIQELKKQRNSISHDQPIAIVLSQKEGLYSEAHEKLHEQLDAVKTIVDQCEDLF